MAYTKGHIHVKNSVMQSVQMGLHTVTTPWRSSLAPHLEQALASSLQEAITHMGLPGNFILALSLPGHQQNLSEKGFLTHLFGMGDLSVGVT